MYHNSNIVLYYLISNCLLIPFLIMLQLNSTQKKLIIAVIKTLKLPVQAALIRRTCTYTEILSKILSRFIYDRTRASSRSLNFSTREFQESRSQTAHVRFTMHSSKYLSVCIRGAFIPVYVSLFVCALPARCKKCTCCRTFIVGSETQSKLVD